MTTSAIIAGGGGDYTTIASWEADADVSVDSWIGEIQDTSEYNENVTISGITGTPSISSYVHLTVTSANRHDGAFASTGHARVKGTSNGSHVFTVSEDFTRFSGLQIEQASSGSSDECVRFAADDCLIEETVCKTANVSSQDCLYMPPNTSRAVSGVNLVLVGGGANSRQGVNLQNFEGFSTLTANLHFVCSANHGLSGIGGRETTQNTTNITCYNCASFDNDQSSAGGNVGDYGADSASNGVPTFSGSDNIASDTTAESNFTASFDSVTLTDTDPVSGENHYVVDASPTYDFELVDEDTETVHQNGVDRTGNEEDSRMDLTVDIVGTTRSTPSIGAFEFVSGGATNVTPGKATYAAYSGQAISTSFAKSVTITSATYAAYTGQNYTVETGATFGPAAGTYQPYTGQNTDLTLAKSVTMAAATYAAYTGQAIQVAVATAVEVAAGTMAVLIGQDINVVKAKSVEVAAATWQYVGRAYDATYAGEIVRVVTSGGRNMFRRRR